MAPKWLILCQLCHLGRVPAFKEVLHSLLLGLNGTRSEELKRHQMQILEQVPNMFSHYFFLLRFTNTERSDFNYDLLSFKKSSESFIDFLEKEVSLKKLGSFSTEYIFSVSLVEICMKLKMIVFIFVCFCAIQGNVNHLRS